MQLVIDSKFRPFSYDELIKPLVQYKETYDKVEADYSNLAAQTEQWKDIANQTQSPEAYAMYSKYANDLNNIVDDFSKGMTLQNRSQLLAMKRRYASDIKPIENAANRRKELADEQRRIDAQDPTRLWQRRASDMSLDEFIHNPSADYGKGISGAALTAQVAAGASALAKEFRDNPEKMRKLVGGDYYEYVKQRGFSSQAVLAAIMNNPDASPVLTNLVESTMDATGVKDWGSKSTIEQAYNYARQGLWNAVGQDEAQLVNNWRAQENLSNAHAMARQKAAQEFQKSEREATQKFQREQTAPREIIGADGKGTGSYYDPKIGMVVDKNGRVMQGQNGNVSKVGTGNQGGTKSTPVDNMGNSQSDFKKVSSVKGQSNSMEKLGYTPLFGLAKLNGTWSTGEQGDDLQGVGLGGTRSKLRSSWYWGDYNLNQKDVTYVDPGPNNDYPSIPQKAKEALAKQLQISNIREGQDIQIVRVHSRGSGTSGEDYDYVICVSQ